MSFRPGSMGIAEGMVLVYLTSFTSVFLSIWTIFADMAATAAWIAPIIGVFCASAMLLILLHIMKQVPGDLYSISETLIGKPGAALIAISLILSFLAEDILLLRQFSENTRLTALPTLDMSVIILWYMFIAAFLAFLGIATTARAAYVVLPFGIGGSLLILLSLSNEFNFYNLAPWMGSGILPVAHTGLLTSGSFASVALLPILAPAFQNQRTIRIAGQLGLMLSGLLRSFTFFVYTGCFGVEVGREKVLPFFEMARLVYVNRFIQRFDTFFILLWVIFAILTIAINLYLAAYLLCRLFNLPSIKPPIVAFAIIETQLAMLPPDLVTTIQLHNKISTQVFSAELFSIPAILLIALLIKGNKGASSCAIKK